MEWEVEAAQQMGSKQVRKYPVSLRAQAEGSLLRMEMTTGIHRYSSVPGGKEWLFAGSMVHEIFPPCLPRRFFRTSSAKNPLIPPLNSDLFNGIPEGPFKRVNRGVRPF